MFWNKLKWSENPGCFERHLQRRNGNILFPPERRKVTKDEVEQAKIRDTQEQVAFIKYVRSFGEEIENPSVFFDPSFLQKVQDAIEKGFSICGSAFAAIDILASTEEAAITCLNKNMPDGAGLLKQAKTLSEAKRIPYLAQLTRKDTPILKDEEVAALLSEDYRTIAIVGYMSRNFPNFKPSEIEIHACLENALLQGFDKDQAQEILNAWNEMH